MYILCIYGFGRRKFIINAFKGHLQPMVSTIARWGNSLAIRLPQHLVKEIQLTEGVEVDLAVIDGNLVIKPRVPKCYSLEELVSAITPENLHTEVDSGSNVGNEAW
jgi:antitoxin MazE